MAEQKEIICYLPDKDEPIIVPAEIENDVRRRYIGHPQELEVRIEPFVKVQPAKKAIPEFKTRVEAKVEVRSLEEKKNEQTIVNNEVKKKRKYTKKK